MINEKMLAAINEQINYELYSGYLYLSMSAWYASINLPGCANWMRVQEQEERFHALKFYDYVIARGGDVKLAAIDGPPVVWDKPVDPFKAGYAHEVTVTERINNLVALAMETRDFAGVTFLDWYVTEQVEEEANADNIIKQFALIGDDRSALFMLDRELALRVFVPPAVV